LFVFKKTKKITSGLSPPSIPHESNIANLRHFRSEKTLGIQGRREQMNQDHRVEILVHESEIQD